MKIKELLKKQNYNFNDLCEIMDILRGENGCPWDGKPQAIRKNLMETYRCGAIDKEDYTLLCEELGTLCSGGVPFGWQKRKSSST